MLRIAGVQPGDRPLSVAIMLAAAEQPATAICVGAHAMGRRHSAPSFPDTELRFDVTAAVRQLGGSTVDVMAVPLSLGHGDYRPPALTWSTVELIDRPPSVRP